MTALKMAAAWGHLEIVRFLIEAGADVNDAEAGTPLSHAMTDREDTEEIVRLLPTAGANPNAAGRLGVTPLFAATQTSGKLVEMLLKAGADANARDTLGNTPLMVAAQAGREDVVRLLLNAGADVNAKSKAGTTARSAASGDQIVQLLSQAGASP